MPFPEGEEPGQFVSYHSGLLALGSPSLLSAMAGLPAYPGALRLGRFGTNDGTDNLPRNAGFPETFSSDKRRLTRRNSGISPGP